MSHWFREGASNQTLSCTRIGGALAKPVAHSSSLTVYHAKNESKLEIKHLRRRLLRLFPWLLGQRVTPRRLHHTYPLAGLGRKVHWHRQPVPDIRLCQTLTVTTGTSRLSAQLAFLVLLRPMAAGEIRTTVCGRLHRGQHGDMFRGFVGQFGHDAADTLIFHLQRSKYSIFDSEFTAKLTDMGRNVLKDDQDEIRVVPESFPVKVLYAAANIYLPVKHGWEPAMSHLLVFVGDPRFILLHAVGRHGGSLFLGQVLFHHLFLWEDGTWPEREVVGRVQDVLGFGRGRRFAGLYGGLDGLDFGGGFFADLGEAFAATAFEDLFASGFALKELGTKKRLNSIVNFPLPKTFSEFTCVC